MEDLRSLCYLAVYETSTETTVQQKSGKGNSWRYEQNMAPSTNAVT
jgi:hypothetical protein